MKSRPQVYTTTMYRKIDTIYLDDITQWRINTLMHTFTYVFRYFCMISICTYIKSIQFTTYLSIHLPIHPFIRLSIYPSIYLSIHLFIHPSIYLSFYLVTFEQLDFKLIIKDSEYDNRVIDLELYEGDLSQNMSDYCNRYNSTTINEDIHYPNNTNCRHLYSIC